MKQGRASSNVSDPKREPIAKAVNPGGADQLGQAMGTRRSTVELYAGKGYEAPKDAGRDIHPSGSQGKHR